MEVSRQRRNQDPAAARRPATSNHFREQMRINQNQLSEVERRIELRRQENEAAVPASAEANGRPF
jgi:hypothetical protein